MPGLSKRRAKQSPLRAEPDALPGASLRRMLIGIVWPVIGFMFALGVTVGLVLSGVVDRWASRERLVVVGLIAGLMVLGGLAVFVRRALRVIDNLAHGISGETVVAESLQLLRAEGYEILHDLPFDSQDTSGGGGATSGGANVDHVVIGPGGIFIIETKLRRKREGEEITFDGERLTIDGRTICERAVGQTLGNARRIAAILEEVTGRTAVPVQPVLVFAGRWWINDTRASGGKDAIWVLNEAGLIKWIRNADPKLSPEDVALYATRLREYGKLR